MASNGHAATNGHAVTNGHANGHGAPGDVAIFDVLGGGFGGCNSIPQAVQHFDICELI